MSKRVTPSGVTWLGRVMVESDLNLVGDDEILYRRCPNKIPSFVKPPDFITKEVRMERAALRLKVGENGLSCYRQKLLMSKGQGPVEVSGEKDGYVFAFRAHAVRDADTEECWDVLFDPVEDQGDEKIGHAHSVVAPCANFRYNKSYKESLELVRTAIIVLSYVAYAPAAKF